MPARWYSWVAPVELSASTSTSRVRFPFAELSEGGQKQRQADASTPPFGTNRDVFDLGRLWVAGARGSGYRGAHDPVAIERNEPKAGVEAGPETRSSCSANVRMERAHSPNGPRSLGERVVYSSNVVPRVEASDRDPVTGQARPGSRSRSIAITQKVRTMW